MSKAAESLSTTEQKILSIETVGVLFFRLDGRIQQANAAFERMSGYTVAELVSMVHWERLTAPEFLPVTRRRAEDLARIGLTPPYEKQMVRKDGSRWWGLFAPTRLCGGGSHSECMEFIIDITDRKQAEAALRESEERYRSLFNSMDEGFCVIEVLFGAGGTPVDYRFVEANPAFALHTGFVDGVGKRMRELVPEHEAHWFEIYGRIAETGVPARFEENAAAMGRFYDVFAFRVGAPELRRVAILFKDISERKRRERNLAFLAGVGGEFARIASPEELMRAVAEKTGEYLDLTHCSYLEIDDSGDLATVLYQCGAPTLPPALPLSELLDGEQRGHVRSGLTITGRNARESRLGVPILREGACKYLFLAGVDASREWRPEEIALLVDLANRTVLRMERARTQAALRESERQFRELADSMPQLVWVADSNGIHIYFNRRSYEQLGVGAEDSLEERWVALLHPEDRQRVLDHWASCLVTGERYQNEYRLRVATGEYRWFLGRALPFRDAEGRITHWYGTSTDIEDNKQAEERLRYTQKLESVGLLAGGIAHDFNNLLTGIMGNASLIVDEVSGESAKHAAEIVSGAERAANLTRQLLAYAGQGRFVIRDLDVSEAVQEISGLVEFSIPKSVQLVLNVQRRMPVVRMDPSQLQQILMNLVINAGEAIGEGNSGKITVSTGIQDVVRPFRDAAGQQVVPQRYACVDVTDTGAGIAREEMSRIFDPFFTTKFMGRGLGLAAVAGILRSQGGGITVESAEGEGTTFRVLLPAGESQAAQESVNGDGPGVLVIDDEASVREFISTVLRRQHYRVWSAADGREALGIWERLNGSVDAVVLDVVMPLMGANELLPQMKARRPGLKVLLTSGYSEAEARRLCAAYPGAAFIQKPYTAQQIANAVERLVG